MDLRSLASRAVRPFLRMGGVYFWGQNVEIHRAKTIDSLIPTRPTI